MKELNMKMPLMFRLGIALLCVMLLSTHFTGNLYARYSTTATGSDSARVAKFDVNAVYNSDTNTVTITNNSEVTVSYTINAQNMPEGFSLKIDPLIMKNLAPGESAQHIVGYEKDYDAEHEGGMFDIIVRIEQVD